METESLKVIIALDNKNTVYYSRVHNLIYPINNTTTTSVLSDLNAILRLIEVQNTDVLILDCTLPPEERLIAEQCARKKNIKTYLLEITNDQKEDLSIFLYQVKNSYRFNNDLLPSSDSTFVKGQPLTESPKAEQDEVNEPIKLADIKKIQESITYLFNYLAIPKHLKGYLYLSAAVEMLYLNPHRYNELKQTMYRLLSTKFNTTQIRISKGMRLAVLQTLQKGNAEALNQIGFHKYTLSEIGNDDHKNNLPSTFCFLDALVSELYRIILEL